MNEYQIANLTLCYEIGLSDIWKADLSLSPCQTFSGSFAILLSYAPVTLQR